MEPTWLDYPAVNKAVAGQTRYADYITHCGNWKYYSVAGSKTTSAHECNHGTNSDIRNKLGRGPRAIYPRSAARHSAGCGCRLSVPVRTKTRGARVNGFYCGRDRAILLPEPKFRKRDIASSIPTSLRAYRYKTYISGQTAWDNEPLYVWDEWVAYCAGAEAGIDLWQRSGDPQSKNTDGVYGVIEFLVYGTAVMMVAASKDRTNFDVLLPFYRWQAARSLRVFFVGREVYPWSDQDAYLNRLRNNAETKAVRDFLTSQELDLSPPDSAWCGVFD